MARMPQQPVGDKWLNSLDPLPKGHRPPCAPLWQATPTQQIPDSHGHGHGHGHPHNHRILVAMATTAASRSGDGHCDPVGDEWSSSLRRHLKVMGRVRPCQHRNVCSTVTAETATAPDAVIPKRRSATIAPVAMEAAAERGGRPWWGAASATLWSQVAKRSSPPPPGRRPPPTVPSWQATPPPHQASNSHGHAAKATAIAR